MRYILTELQYQKLLESEYYNFKPSREFDKIYGTNLSQTWDFGNDLTSDDVWDIIQICIEEDECDEFNNLIDRLDESMFPYPGVENLSLKTKYGILQGMASEFNYDDIVHFVIDDKTGITDKDFDEFYKKLSKKEKNHVQWISSPKTTKIMKKVMNKN